MLRGNKITTISLSWLVVGLLQQILIRYLPQTLKCFYLNEENKLFPNELIIEACETGLGEGRRLCHCWHWTLLFPGRKRGRREAWGETRHHSPILMREIVPRKRRGCEKPAGTWSHSFKPMPVCRGGGEVQVKNFAPETQSGAIAYLRVIKPQGIPYWNFPSKTRNEICLYECAHMCVCVYIYSAHVPVQLMHLNCSKCLSQRLVFLFRLFFLPSASPSFIFYLFTCCVLAEP